MPRTVRCLVLLICAGALAAEEPGRWLQFFGRFHLVTLHLPIGLMIALAVVEARTWWMRQLAPDPVRRPLVLATAAAATVSVVFGLMLAQNDDYAADLLFLHQWLGIATAVVSVALIGLDHLQRRTPGTAMRFRFALIAGLALMTITGHFGGSLTHGRGFLTRNAPWTADSPKTSPATPAPAPAPARESEPAPTPAQQEEPVAAPAMTMEPDSEPLAPPPAVVQAQPPPSESAAPASDEAVSFTRQIAPILSERCYSCHGADKQKAGLRLDSQAAIRSGAKNGAVLVAGHPEMSPLYTSLVLPEDDDAFMPAKGGPLKAEQIALIKQWIASGAPFDEPASAGAPEAAAPAKAPSLIQPPTGYDQLATSLGVPDEHIIEALTAAGGVVRALSRDGKALEINLSHTKGAIDGKLLEKVGKIGANVIWLDLGGTGITGAQLTLLRSLPNLQRLHLERTVIDDTALVQVLPMIKLEYLNLVATQVSDAGLYRLKGLTALRRLYLWQSKVTKAGAARIAADLPHCVVSNGP